MHDAEDSIGKLLQALVGNIARLGRAELHVALADARRRVEEVSAVTVHLAAGIVAALVAAVFLLLAGMYALALWIPLWGAALLIALVPASVAAHLLLQHRRTHADASRPRPFWPLLHARVGAR